MPASTIDVIANRLNSICAGAPFNFTLAPTPFNFDTMPTGEIDGGFRIETQLGRTVGQMNFSENRFDEVRVWIARKALAVPHETYRLLQADASSLTAAIVRDGLTGGGDYHVPDEGRGATFSQNRGNEYAVLRLTLTVDYEATL